jgi:hypothetical protein
MGSRTRPTRGPDLARGGERGAWRREPLVWLAAAVFVASVAASAWTIVVATRHADEPLPTHERSVIGMPVAHAPGAAPADGGDNAGPR